MFFVRRRIHYSRSSPLRGTEGEHPDHSSPFSSSQGVPDSLVSNAPNQKTGGTANMRIAGFLVETDDNKHPSESSMGAVEKEFGVNKGENAAEEGHLARNIRLALRLKEMAEPAIRFDVAANKMYGIGCSKIDSVELLDVCSGSAKPLSVVQGSFPAKCMGLRAWSEDGQDQVEFC